MSKDNMDPYVRRVDPSSVDGKDAKGSKKYDLDDLDSKGEPKTDGEGKGKDEDKDKDSDSDNKGNGGKAKKSGDTIGEDDSEKGDKKEGKKASMNKQLARAQVAAKTAETGAKVGVAFKMFAYFKNLAMMAAAGVKSAISSLVGFVMGIGGMIGSAVSAVGGAIGTIGTFIASAATGLAGLLGTSVAVGGTILGGIAVTTAGLVVGGALVVFGPDPAVLDGIPIDCATIVQSAQTEASDMSDDQVTFENAKSVYSVMSTYGLSDNAIAGILGNWSIESGIDPTGVEGIYNEKHHIGPRKEKALNDPDTFTRDLIFNQYSHLPINHDQYKNSDGIYFMGLGLPQFTPGSRITKVSAELGRNWYELDFQLAFILAMGTDATTGAKGGRDFFNTFKTEAATMSASEAAMYFTRYYEGNTTMHQSERQSAANDWASQLSSWTIDESYASSVISMASQLGGIASDGAIGSKLNECVRSMNYDNSTIAAAAVSYAYPTQAEGRGNNGTVLYQRVHDNVFPGDHYYQSCDRGVGAAIRWSGSDDKYPAGSTGVQNLHLKVSPRWEKVGNASSLTMDDLQPGDVFMVVGHTFMYVGQDLITQIHGDGVVGDSVSASLNERSPGVDGGSSSIINRMGGRDWIGRGVYSVYRMVDPQNSPKYQNAGAMAN